MQTLPDYHLDALFRAAMLEGAEELASTAASESQMLERVGQLLARRRTRRQLATVLLAAGLTTLVAAAIALGGSRLTPPVTPEPSPEASATPEPALGTELDEGPVVLWNPRTGGPPITVTIPAPGWSMDPGNRVLVKNENQSQPDGAYLHGWWATGEFYIPGDPCQWQSTMPDTPATTVEEIVAALAGQASRDASAPADITVDGHDGQSIRLHVPDDLPWAAGDFTDCDQGVFCGCFHTLYRPGQVDEMWIVDVDGQVLFMEAAYYPETPGEHVDELRAILGSMTFGEPPGPDESPPVASVTDAPLDWTGPVRQERAGATIETIDSRLWSEPIDTSPRWVDIAAVAIAPVHNWRLELGLDSPSRDALSRAGQVLGFGYVVDTNGDGVADYVMGIDTDAEAPLVRAWLTDLATGETQETSTGPYGDPFDFRTTLEGEDPVGPPNGPPGGTFFDVGFAPPELFDYPTTRFYAWASLTENGEVVAWDYAPDTAWLGGPRR